MLEGVMVPSARGLLQARSGRSLEWPLQNFPEVPRPRAVPLPEGPGLLQIQSGPGTSLERPLQDAQVSA